MEPLLGRAALVTGGTRGIGRAVAVALARAGMRVTLTGRDAEAARAAARAVAHDAEVAEGAVLGLAADVRDLEAVRQAVAATVERFGTLDAVVANAGLGRFASVDELTPEAWREVIDVNLTGAFHTVQASVAALTASSGVLVTIGSLAGVNAFAGGAAYNAAKFGLLGFTHAVMLDLRERGVRVSTIMPGSVATAFGGHEPGEADAWKIQPEDLADAVLYVLRSPARTLPSRIEVRPARPRSR
jgi:NAD(P)-dependent dehydrogenase (short-subunit alcohol dehydrogenase family)